MENPPMANMQDAAENMGFTPLYSFPREFLAAEADNVDALCDMTPAFVLCSDWWDPEAPQCDLS